MDEIEEHAAGDGAGGGKVNGNGDGNGGRYRYAVAALIVVVMLGLVVYLTYRTGQIPYTIAGPLLAAALAALFGFKASDWRR